MISIAVIAMLNESTLDTLSGSRAQSSDIDRAFFRAGSIYTTTGMGHWAGVLVRTEEGTNPIFRGTTFQRLWVVSDAEQRFMRISTVGEAQAFADRLGESLRRELPSVGLSWDAGARVTAFSPAPQSSATTTQPVAPMPATTTQPVAPMPAPRTVPAAPAYYPPAAPDETPWGWYVAGALLVGTAAYLIGTDTP